MILGQVQDRWGRTVKLIDHRWDHVVREHPEMVFQRSLTMATVAFPDFVMSDALREDRENFYRVVEWNQNGRPRRYLKVCVEYSETGGIIITSFRSRGIRPGESQRWP